MELILLTVWSKVGEGVDLVRDEVYLVPRADLHQLQGELPAVDRAQGVVGVAVEKPPDLLTELALGEDGLLQQAPTEGEGLVVLLCKAESQREIFKSVGSHLPDGPPPLRSSFSPSCRRRSERRWAPE